MTHRFCVMGLGYIGLPTAGLLATRGARVHGVDVNAETVETINRGRIHICEPALDVMIRAAVQSGNLVASTEPVEADVFVLAVPTPLTGDHQPDVSYIEAATRAIAPYVRPGNLVILESTSPVGTTEQVALWLKQQRPDLQVPSRNAPASADTSDEQVYVAHCPERVLPGQILRELVENDRVIGGVDAASTAKAAALYRSFVAGQVLTTDSRTAEMVKLTENAFRDVNIAFANELSMLCDQMDIDVWELIECANRHPRVDILRPGPGVGGHCIAVDPWFIVASNPEGARLIRTAREVNDAKPQHVIEAIRHCAQALEHPVIACLGLAFKPNVDDLRESPAVTIAEALASDGIGEILAVEPHIGRLPPRLAGVGVELVDVKTALARADVVALLVDHSAFHSISEHALSGKQLVDTQGRWRARRL